MPGADTPRRPKVVHVTTVHPPLDNRIFLKECRSLVRAGYEVVLLAPAEADGELEGVRLRALARYSARPVRMLLGPLAALRAALEEQADIYHVHDPELLPVANVLSALGRRVVYDMHENVPRSIPDKPYLPTPLRPMVAAAYTGLERALLARLPVVFAETSYARDYGWVRRSATVLNLPEVEALTGLSPERFDVPSLGYIGGVSPVRGSHVMLAALGRLQRKGHPVRLEVVGRASPAHQAELEAQIGREALRDVTFHGYLPAREGWPVIARCHIGLAVLAPIGNYTESYPTKIFEYMALGIPFVTSNFPLYREIAEGHGCGLCVDPQDPEALAAAIAWLIEHPAEAACMGERGRQAILSRLNWAHEAHKLLAFYEGLAA